MAINLLEIMKILTTSGNGNGGKRWGNGKDVSCPPPGQAAAAASQGPVAANGAAASDTPSPSKPVSNYDVLVDFDEAQISLGHLHEMLESTKAYFPEGHKRIVEIRAAIDKGHQKRCQITDPEQLVPQTERNIVNKQRAIDKSISKIDELKAQRDDIDSQISNLESKLKDDQALPEEPQATPTGKEDEDDGAPTSGEDEDKEIAAAKLRQVRRGWRF